MNNKMKLFFSFLFACILISNIAAATIVSPALNVLAKKNKMIKSGLVYTDVYFSEQDFMKCLGVTEVESVKVETLPLAEKGTLKLGTLHVTEGQTIQSEYLSMLHFVPIDTAVTEAGMTFSCEGREIPCVVKLLDTVNFAPTFAATEEDVQTYRNVSCYGNVRVSDPEGDTVQLHVVSYPEHGTLSITDPVRGNYTYTPTAGFVGKDTFVVVAHDEYGNYSNPKTIGVRVGKTGVSFTDTVGHWCENAAICLYEAGVVEAINYQNGLVFCPEDTVSREEFVTMVMKTVKADTLTDAETSFADNDTIDVRYRPYVATAVRMGYINGREIDGRMCFDPKATITKAEAAVVMNRVLGAEEVEYVTVFADDSTIPAWAKTAVYALTSAGVFNGDGNGTIAPSALLSRAQTVQMLYNILSEQ